ncbi:flagellar biosynthesis protein FlhF [Legionella micdadei]|uniref:Flagellar biosynthesis protein FlhF n=1 Tax=Legionella micdadei TaxID=451 RepID=A0A098GG03_LEGMI|nr:flagellar biosynthesis protein FlhF [Legionella micdadei]ARG97962.1 flagellar biosynthesis protein FlhF [Legionella micdadei]ARG99719.1 flagellar biosynthesis protein FlhF [Legionella micdadei]KTD30241.1 flagellar GTP-binding protein FlhF [Legionella micdadei]NSL19217.1 flagellar biosynthesis protein FlhF [Legionella micdadei]CEG60416.1 Flagellar biosynthesis protein FlhF [Legionella micdadei]
MKLKRFVAPDTRSAMQQIKATFGPDAVILSSSRVEGGVEIVAAVDFDETVLATSTAIATAEPITKATDTPTPSSPLDDMRQEILTLRGMLEAQLRGYAGHGEPLHTVLMQKLLNLGVSHTTASSLVTKINPSLNQQSAWQQVLTLFSDALPIRDSRRIEEGGIYAFVGPTGVGKTTTLAKIAARFALRFGADKLGLVTMDTYRIAAQEQLMLYGKILGVQVCVAQDEVALSRVIRQLNDKKLILIDTAGMNPADERVEMQMDILSSRLHSISIVLVLQATNHYQVLIDAIRRFHVERIEQCIVTKLDESLALGGILSAIAETGIGVSYLTHGQRVPEDIKIATRHQLIEQLTSQEVTLNQINGQEHKAPHAVAGRLYVEG